MFKYLFNIYNLFLKHKIFFPKKTYSCFGEDIFVDKFFKKKFFLQKKHSLALGNIFLLLKFLKKKNWDFM